MAQPLTIPRWLRWTGLAFVLLVLGILLVASLMDEPVRGYIERNANAQLEGYHLRIGKLDLHPLNLSLDVEDVALIQTAQPEPPMVMIPTWHASLQWSQLLRGHVVSDHALDRPAIHFTRVQAKEEAEDPKTKAWQDTIQEIYPVSINKLTIHDGAVTYFDQPRAKPLQLSHLNVELDNITNRESDRTYPSNIRLETTNTPFTQTTSNRVRITVASLLRHMVLRQQRFGSPAWLSPPLQMKSLLTYAGYKYSVVYCFLSPERGINDYL